MIKTIHVRFIEKHTESICYTTDLKFLENYKFVDLTGVNNVGVANNNIVYVGGYTSERGLFIDEYNGNQKLEKKKVSSAPLRYNEGSKREKEMPDYEELILARQEEYEC